MNKDIFHLFRNITSSIHHVMIIFKQTFIISLTLKKYKNLNEHRWKKSGIILYNLSHGH